jgi:sugar lactone lactonase YvrE
MTNRLTKCKFFSFFLLLSLGVLLLNPSPDLEVEGTVYPTYTLIQTIGTTGLEPGNFTTPWNLALDAAGNIFVTDQGGGRDTVEILSRSGSWIRNITGFSNPSGVAVQGNKIYVTDPGANNVSILQNYLLVNSTSVNGPRGVTIDAQGNIWVASFNDDAVYIYSSSLTLLGTLDGIDGAEGVAFAPDGRIFVASYWDSNVTVFAPDHSLLGYLGGFGSGPGQFNNECLRCRC